MSATVINRRYSTGRDSNGGDSTGDSKVAIRGLGPSLSGKADFG
jgi:hypothetical protein